MCAESCPLSAYPRWDSFTLFVPLNQASGTHPGSKYGCPGSPGLHFQATGLQPDPWGFTLPLSLLKLPG